MIAFMLAAAQVAIASPDRSVEIRIAADGATYSVSRRKEAIVADSPLGLEMAGAPALGPLKLVGVRKERRNRTIALTATKAAAARDRYNGGILTFEEAAPAGRRLTIEVRAYDDGVAFRYLMPAGTAVAIAGEKTGFRLAGDPACITSEFAGSHEMAWKPARPSQLDPAKLYDMPLLCASPSGRSQYAIAQAGLAGYAGSALRPVAGGVQVELMRPPGRADVAVASPDGLSSAWRVIMMADRAGELIESQLIGNLAPQATGDFSWVRPGKTAWDWWSGPTAGAKPTMERYRRFIDFAAASGFPYFLIDAGWALNNGPCCAADPRTDITRSDPAIDIPELVRYAGAKGVGLLLWVHWEHLAPRMDEVLDTYQRWGIKGVKADFMMRDDQEMVAFYLRLAEATARRHLLLDMHGAFPPVGFARTWPNYITQEGVMGLEYDKFAWGEVTPSHNVKIAYSRMLLGPMDYTPGGFRNFYPEAYRQSEVMPATRFTRGQAIAQYVVYESPLQMVSDDPEAYAGAPGFDFVKAVPTAWDETRFIDGTPESHIVLARRKGRQWFIGAMTNEQGRDVDIPLALLGAGRYRAEVWQDGATANDVDRTVSEVSRRDVLHIRMSRGGGAAAILTPVK